MGEWTIVEYDVQAGVFGARIRPVDFGESEQFDRDDVGAVVHVHLLTEDAPDPEVAKWVFADTPSLRDLLGKVEGYEIPEARPEDPAWF